MKKKVKNEETQPTFNNPSNRTEEILSTDVWFNFQSIEINLGGVAYVWLLSN